MLMNITAAALAALLAQRAKGMDASARQSSGSIKDLSGASLLIHQDPTLPPEVRTVQPGSGSALPQHLAALMNPNPFGGALLYLRAMSQRSQVFCSGSTYILSSVNTGIYA